MPKKPAPSPRAKRTDTPTSDGKPTTAVPTPPNFLLDTPAPRSEVRVFHRTPMAVWVGRVPIDKIQGWVENERISLHVKQFEREFSRLPTNKELYQIVLRHDREFKIKDLSRLIYYNGVKIPVIVDSHGNLLDGNRRYFASLLLRTSNPEEESLKTIPAYVLQHDISDADRRKIIIEMNFVDDGRVEWSSYVRAEAVWRDYSEGGQKDYGELANTFGWTRTRVKQTVEVMQLIAEFIAFHTEPETPEEGVKRLGDAMKAELVAAENYVYFWEARNKYADALDLDPAFKEWFFEVLALDIVKNLQQVRDFWQCWIREQSKNEMLKRTPLGLETGRILYHATLQGIKVEGPESSKPEFVEKRIKDFTTWMNDKVGVGGLKRVSAATLMDLREVLHAVTEACAALAKPAG